MANTSDKIANVNLQSASQNVLYHGKFTENLNVNNDIDKTLAFDGSVDILGDVSKTDGSLIFQAHPILHAGQKVKADQSDWENREFTMANLNLNSANFYLSGNAKLNTNIIAENSKIFLGSDKILLDKNDGTGKETTAIEDTLANSYRSSFTGGISATMSDVEISSSDVN